MTGETQFEVSNEDMPVALPFEGARWAMKAVHEMVGPGDTALPCTYLADMVALDGHLDPRCTDYAGALNGIIQHYKLGESRILQVAMVNNGYDVHTLVEYFYAKQSQWIVLDPTFNLTATRKSDGGFATAADISRAVRLFQWNAIDLNSPTRGLRIITWTIRSCF